MNRLSIALLSLVFAVVLKPVLYSLKGLVVAVREHMVYTYVEWPYIGSYSGLVKVRNSWKARIGSNRTVFCILRLPLDRDKGKRERETKLASCWMIGTEVN